MLPICMIHMHYRALPSSPHAPHTNTNTQKNARERARRLPHSSKDSQKENVRLTTRSSRNDWDIHSNRGNHPYIMGDNHPYIMGSPSYEETTSLMKILNFQQDKQMLPMNNTCTIEHSLVHPTPPTLIHTKKNVRERA